MKLNQTKILFIRNFIFGAEDSLVSTVGLLSGVAVGGMAAAQIILTGVVLIFVEAFSMGVGSYLSEYSAEESQHQRQSSYKSAWGGVVMMISYLVIGLIPLMPYIVFKDQAFEISVGFSLLSLFILGAFSAYLLKTPIFKSAIRMLLVGGIAVFVGVIVAKLIH